MVRASHKLIVYFFALLALQLVVLNNVHLGGFINPYGYVFFILALPVYHTRWAMLVMAFLIGLVVDIFLDTMGMHAAATVFMAFCRPATIKLISKRDRFDDDEVPRFSSMGRQWIISYTLILVFVHHLFLFFLEVFRLSNFQVTLWNAFLNTLVTSFIVLFIFFVIDKPSKR